VKLFVDRDLGPAIGRALKEVGLDVVNHVERFPPEEPDEVWIAAVTADDRVILSKDRHLKSRPAERAACEVAGARCFVLTAEKANRLDLLRMLMVAWDGIVAKVAGVPGPFMYGIGRDGRLTQWLPVEGPGGPAERACQLQEDRAGRRERRREARGEPRAE
jgi:predicted nuclease of predicted toxin-antitoxin system